MKVTKLEDEAQRLALSVEAARKIFEQEIGKGKILGVLTPDGSGVLCFGEDEVEAVSSELSSGKVSLANLSLQLGLSDYHVYLFLQYLLKTDRISGELTYSSFISKATTKKLQLEKAVAHKRNHRRQMNLKKR